MRAPLFLRKSAGLQAAGSQPEFPVERKELTMKIHESEGEVVYEGPDARGVQLYSGHGDAFVVLSVGVGGRVPAHTLDIPVTFYVVGGEGQISVDGTPQPVRAGDLLDTPAGSERAVVQSGGEQLKLLVIKHVGGGE